MQQSLISSALQSLADGLEKELIRTTEKPSEWIQKHFYVPDPRDPVTGVFDGKPGPIRLSEHQCRIIDEALSKKPDGDFKYTTIIYSAPKKSGKSAITSAVILYMAYHYPYSFLACIANDGKQANDRLYGPISNCVRLHKQLGGIFKNENPTIGSLMLSNRSKIEAIPCDAAGEAGSQPLVSAFCFDEETEILTKEGWRRYTDVDENTIYATVSPTGDFEWQKAHALYREKYIGKMCFYDNTITSICVTPNHRFLGRYRNGHVEEDSVFEIQDMLKKHKKGFIQLNQNAWGKFEGSFPDFVKNGMFSFAARSKRKKHRESLDVSLEDFVELLAWFLSEGCIKYKTRNGKTMPECVMIAASKETNPTGFEHIWNLISRMGLKPSTWKNNNSICFYDMRVTTYFSQFGLAQDKFIPAWVKNLPVKYLQIFLHAYYDGDGCSIEMGKPQYGFSISTISKKMSEDLSEIGVKLNYSVTLSEYKEPRSQYTSKIVRFRGSQTKKYIGTRVDKWQYIDYDGYVWCPSTSNGTVFVRRGRSSVYLSKNSELWGYETPNKRRIFTEMTVPPTLYGKAIRWIESYAGYSGVSELLEQIYNTGFTEGVPHPDFLDLVGRDGPVVRTNARANMFVYWDTEHRMSWQQNPQYYIQEAEILPSTEFDRIHNNMWVSPTDSFLREEWWDACEKPDLPVLESSSTPVVVGIDMAETGDCAALVAVTRDPFSPDTKIAVRAVKIFNPKQLGGIIDQEQDVRPVLEEWRNKWNVVCWVYDPREMAKLAQDLMRDGFGWFKKFGQTNPRAVSDKTLFDMVVARHISWNRHTTWGDVGFPGDPSRNSLRKHITLAGANTTGGGYRLIKLSNANKIDAAVALSQAVFTAMELAIGNDEMNMEKLITLYQRREITEQEFSERVKQARPKLKERMLHGSH